MKFDPNSLAQRPVRIGEIAYRFDNLDVQKIGAQALIQLGLRLDPLHTLIVDETADASAVAEIVDGAEIKHVVVRSPAGPLTGIVDVTWAKEQVRKFMNYPVDNFQDAVKVVFQSGMRGGSYHHEHLTQARPPLVYCRGGHWADSDPCSIHR